MYPFGKLNVGDSFLIPETSNIRNRADRVKSAACYFGKRNNVKLATRVVEGGIRVWRTA
jgi:hypothetical protein